MTIVSQRSYLIGILCFWQPIWSILIASTALFLSISIQLANAHPHVFADARLEVFIDKDKQVESLAHIWRFDEFFSSTVLMEFDKNGDLLLDQEELDTLAKTIKKSLADFNYFQTIQANGKEVQMLPPSEFVADFQNNQLLIIFKTKPATAMKLDKGQTASFGIYDPSFYTAIDFNSDDDLKTHGLPQGCKAQIIRPDPDEALRENQSSLTEAFFNDPKGTDMSKIFATRLKIDCDDT